LQEYILYYLTSNQNPQMPIAHKQTEHPCLLKAQKKRIDYLEKYTSIRPCKTMTLSDRLFALTTSFAWLKISNKKQQKHKKKDQF